MSVYVMGDLHLSGNADKSMEVFGGAWEGYIEKISRQWMKTVTKDDVVVLPGDISWGMSLEESRADFEFLHNLPGEKVILKGNHDYWWTTKKKMTSFLEENGLTSIGFIHNSCKMAEGVALCGTRGWTLEGASSTGEDRKIVKREAARLLASLAEAKKQNPARICAFLHYPPIYKGSEIAEFTELLEEYKVFECFYGHLHGASFQNAFDGFKNGVKYTLVSADYLNFKPYLVKKT